MEELRSTLKQTDGRICGMNKLKVILVTKEGDSDMFRMLSSPAFTNLIELEVIEATIYPNRAEELRVEAFPSTLVYRGGTLLAEFRGSVEKDYLLDVLKDL